MSLGLVFLVLVCLGAVALVYLAVRANALPETKQDEGADGSALLVAAIPDSASSSSDCGASIDAGGHCH